MTVTAGGASGAGGGDKAVAGSGLDPDLRARSLAGVPLFAGLEEDLERGPTPLEGTPWAELVAVATPARVTAGEWLWHQGDPGDSLYVVLTGRLEVVVEHPEPRVIRILGRGAAVGELAILTESARSAGVRAARDSELLRVARDDFHRILDGRPEFAMALTRTMSRQLRDVRLVGIEPDPVPSTIAVVALSRDLACRDLSHYLMLALSQWRSVRGVDGAGADDEAGEGERAYAVMLDRLERSHEQVVLVAEDPDPTDRWTSFCLRQADRVLAVAGAAGMTGGAVPRLRGCDLLVLGDGTGGPPPLDPLLAALDPRSIDVVRAERARPPAIERIARRFAGRALGLVLSGGGARAFAHVGVLEEIEARGYAVDRVAGTSGGAYIGALHALGRPSGEILEICRREFVEDNPINDYTLPLVALTRSLKGRAMLRRVFGDARIEELDKEFFCMSTDMETAEPVAHRRGLVREAVGASMTLPGVSPPYELDGRLLLDGGLLNNLPVDVMATTGEGPMIAVDVSAHFEAPAERPRRVRRPRLVRIADRVHRAIVGPGGELPGFSETLTRAIVLGSNDTTEMARRYADVVIFPDVSGKPMLGWDHLDDMYEEGRRAASEAFDRAPAGVLA